MPELSDQKAFSRIIEAGSISSRGSERRIEANAAECKALADLLDLQAIGSLAADLSMRRLASGLIEIKGRLEADVIQTCVVTLEPVPAKVSESFRVTFGEGVEEPDLTEIDLDYEDQDPPEPIVDGMIDLGALVAEHLSLGLDPYPRKADAAIPTEYEAGPLEVPEIERPATRKPFAGLDKLIK
ncbi:DUF177 domain-containing protein [Dongia sp.]|uniref:YceD family protein n=1 Tax=Dongia sp. TaxID=1977262 RepID=UPI0035AFBE27